MDTNIIQLWFCKSRWYLNKIWKLNKHNEVNIEHIPKVRRKLYQHGIL